MKEENPLVSICIPAYEYPKLLDRCLDSILEQTYQNFEIIVTDDSSHDKLFQIAASKNDNRIKYFKNSIPLGSPANWNFCIEKSIGKLIKILHHDDWFSQQNALHEFVKPFVKNENLKFAFSQCTNVSDNKSCDIKIREKVINKVKNKPSLLLLYNAVGAPSTTIFLREVFDEIKFDINSKWYVDVLFYAQIFKKYKSIEYIKNTLINVTAQSTTQVTNNIPNLLKLKEAIYAFEINDIFKKKKLDFVEFISLVELIKRYKVKSLNELESFDIEIQRKIDLPIKIARLPISYQFYAILRHMLIKINFF